MCCFIFIIANISHSMYLSCFYYDFWPFWTLALPPDQKKRFSKHVSFLLQGFITKNGPVKCPEYVKCVHGH
jgi:hypothetical protein